MGGQTALAQAPLVQGTVWQAGGDAVVRTPLGRYTVNAEAEVNYGKFSNSYGSLALKGGRVQVGASRGASAWIRTCALPGPSRTAVGGALHAFTLLIAQRLVNEIAGLGGAARIKILRRCVPGRSRPPTSGTPHS